MASGQHHDAAYNDDDDDEEEHLNDVVLDDDDEEDADADDSPASSDSDDASVVPISSSAAAVSVAAPSNGSNPNPPPPVMASFAAPTAAVVAMAAPSAVAATPVSERRPLDDSRRLFQRLWTDEDEIELLQGFLEYTSQRGPNWSGHHHDTTAFYDRIKSKLQLDCNKNQLVEKLRRLKKKYRTVVGRISSGKEFAFKSPHDQATFEISRKIWSNSIANRPELDDDDHTPKPNSAAPVIANLSAGDYRTSLTFGIDINSPDKMMMINMATPDSRLKKRPRVKMEEKCSRNLNSGGFDPVNAAPAAVPAQGVVEETTKNRLPALLKELLGNAVGGARGISSLASNAIPMNFPRVNPVNGGVSMEERWRKQQILELEVYSKRLELVQEQVKLTLEDLRTRGN